MKIRILSPRNKQIPDSSKSPPFGNNTKLKVRNKILNLTQIQHSENSKFLNFRSSQLKSNYWNLLKTVRAAYLLKTEDTRFGLRMSTLSLAQDPALR